MNKLISGKVLAASLTVALLCPAFASADSVGGCGLGSKIFHGQQGIAPQSLAITTNGFYGTNTFGITFGTLGCEQNGVVRSNWKVAMYLKDNMNRFAKDVSVGEGESLDSLATLLNVDSSDKAIFKQTLKENFANIIKSSEATSEEVLASLKEVLASDKNLNKYSAAL